MLPLHLGQDTAERIDLVLLTHPRSLADVRRTAPWSRRLSDEELRARLSLMRPVMRGRFASSIACGAAVFLPRLPEQIVAARSLADTRRRIAEALALARDRGARVAVLGGLTSSATRHGHVRMLSAFDGTIRVTTGHTTTALCVCRSLEDVMSAAGLSFLGRKVGFVGMGSVGSACARWLTWRHPEIGAIVLCDLAVNRRSMERTVGALRERGFGGKASIRVASDPACIPRALYGCDVLVSATNRPGLIDIRRVAAGTILVDDSQPWCWSRADANRRVAERGDIIAVEGGLLDGGALGTAVDVDLMGYAEARLAEHAQTLWSCLAEGMLLVQDPRLPPTRGSVSIGSLRRYEEKMAGLGIVPAPPQCGGFFYRARDFERFRRARGGGR